MKKLALILMLSMFGYGCTTGVQAGGPVYDLPDVAGGSLRSADLQGNVVICDVWATWCAPCIKEIPMLNELHEKYKGTNVKVIAITVQSGTLEEVKPFIPQFDIKYPVAVGTEETEEAFGGIIGFPTTFVIDKDGKIFQRIMGSPANKRELLEQHVATLLGQ